MLFCTGVTPLTPSRPDPFKDILSAIHSPCGVPNLSSGVEAPPFLTELKDWAMGVEGSERLGLVDELSTPESLETLLGSTLVSDI